MCEQLRNYFTYCENNVRSVKDMSLILILSSRSGFIFSNLFTSQLRFPCFNHHAEKELIVAIVKTKGQWGGKETKARQGRRQKIEIGNSELQWSYGALHTCTGMGNLTK